MISVKIHPCECLQEEFEEDALVPLARMAYGEVGQCWASFSKPPGALTTGRFVNTMRSRVKEIDPSTGMSHVLPEDPSACMPSEHCASLHLDAVPEVRTSSGRADCHDPIMCCQTDPVRHSGTRPKGW